MVTSMQADAPDRIKSEKEFHNKRFTEETRQQFHPLYRVVEHGFDYYRDLFRRRSLDRDVLEYGCGKGERSLELATACRSITGIDLSDVAICQAEQSAHEAGLVNARFFAMNAEQMSFADGSFDFVFGSSILHHLELTRAYSEIARVLRPGGSALFLEPLGHNPLINAFRARTPEARTPDEHPLLKRDIDLALRWFERVDTSLYGLCTLAAIPVVRLPIAAPLLRTGKLLDQIALRLPGIKWWAWFSVLEFRKSH